MYTIGRLCMKIAGRDAGKYCLVVDEQDGRIVVDGQTRRRAVNVTHLEPINKVAKIKKGASHDEVVKALADFGIVVEEYEKRSKRTDKKPAKEAKK